MSAIAARDLHIKRGDGWSTYIKAGDAIPEHLVKLVAAKDKRRPKNQKDTLADEVG